MLVLASYRDQRLTPFLSPGRRAEQVAEGELFRGRRCSSAGIAVWHWSAGRVGSGRSLHLPGALGPLPRALDPRLSQHPGPFQRAPHTDRRGKVWVVGRYVTGQRHLSWCQSLVLRCSPHWTTSHSRHSGSKAGDQEARVSLGTDMLSGPPSSSGRQVSQLCTPPPPLSPLPPLTWLTLLLGLARRWGQGGYHLHTHTHQRPG